MHALLRVALVAGLVAAWNGAAAIDVTDEAAVVAALNAEMGWDAEADDMCIVTEAAFPDVAVVGGFAHDRGCMIQFVLADGTWLAPGEAASPVLQARGWADADDAARAELAMTWVEFGVFPFHGIVHSANDDFAVAGAPEFAPPRAVAENGVAVVTLWVQEPGGMVRETVYKQWELTFDGDGRQVRTRVLADHVVQY